MRSELPQNPHTQWVPLSLERSIFANDVANGLKWLINLLEKTEQEKRLRKTIFDIAIDQREHRKAS